MKIPNNISVFIPIYNEEEVILLVIENIKNKLSEKKY
jgi:glycosyltransferase involved in cell wall biosynthesis